MKIFRFLLLVLSLFLSTLCFSYETKKITIFVHGTRRLSKLFIKYTDQEDKIVPVTHVPSSYITRSISKALAKSDPENFANEHFYVFGWSGKLNHQARVEAAHILYQEINNLINRLKKEDIYPRINLITHSHGGNVVLNLAQCIKNNNPEFYIDNVIILACPVQHQTSEFIHHAIFKNIYHVYSPSDLVQILDPQGWHPENKDKKVPFFSQRMFNYCPKLKQATIKINDKDVSHAGFLSSKFFQRLPKILHIMDKSDSQSVGAITL